ncbi:MAG: hypothetical protein KAU01_11385 [Candidatus Cloacimonetes bacterium]|nr:hypothetical protein [Candidatus Cloacimonadota bacterium]
MKNEVKKLNPIFGLMFILIILFFIGCGESLYDKQVKEKEQKEFLREEEIRNQLNKKYNAVYFPPDNIDANSFTYEIQDFFKKQSHNLFAFEGYLEDIEQTNDDIIIEFLCPIGNSSLISKDFIRFKLSITHDLIKQFPANKEDDFRMNFLRYMHDPDYLIIASIDDVKGSRIYTFNGYDIGEEIKIDIDKSKRIISIGKFVDAVPINENFK